MRTRIKWIGVGLALLSGVAFAEASSWPGFRGPNGMGIAEPHTEPALEWSDSQNLKWKTDLPGPGSSSPIVWEDRVFVTCYSGYGVDEGGSPGDLRRHLLCLDRATGKILWNSTVPAELPEDPYRGYLTEHGYASSTPVTDGERIYVFFGKTGALAFDFEGKQIWKVHLGQSSSNRRWGSGASPILYGDTVIVNAAEESRAVYALDKRTGQEVWRAEGNALELCFGTPALVNVEGARADLVLAVPGELWGLDPDTGKRRWYAETGIGGNVSPSVSAAHGVIYATGGYPRLGSIAIRGGGEGNVTDSHVVWSGRNASYVPTPAVYDGYVLMVNDQGFAMCLAADTGDLVYKERLPGMSGGRPVYASPVIANGNLYAVSRRSGTYVLEVGPNYKLLAHNKLAGDDAQFNGTPAVADQHLFLRSDRALYCIETMPAASTEQAP